jgi:glycosyltransferase involved in cell wall biosynthesis
MAEGRKTLALALTISEDWIGGTYYVLNLIKALNVLEDSLKPNIIILSPEPHALRFTQKETGYPYLSFIRTVYSITSIKGIINAINIRLLKKKTFTKNVNIHADVLYPAWNSLRVSGVKKRICWIPDFQEHYLTDFFSPSEINTRKEEQKYIAQHALHLVVSSHDARNDFEKFYPQHQCRVDILPFAVSNPDIRNVDYRPIFTKYGLVPGYFFIANQLWVHKNHFCVLEAAKKLKEEGLDYQFVFTGNTNDNRSAGHFKNIMQRVSDWDLKKTVKFLGFIDRSDQLVLMKHADFVIQPSLFEGWSTVVEDAKSFNRPILASDIAVHKEQLAEYPHILFARNNSHDLAEKIKKMHIFCKTAINYDYEAKRKEFAEKIVNVLLN